MRGDISGATYCGRLQHTRLPSACANIDGKIQKFKRAFVRQLLAMALH